MAINSDDFESAFTKVQARHPRLNRGFDRRIIAGVDDQLQRSIQHGQLNNFTNDVNYILRVFNLHGVQRSAYELFTKTYYAIVRSKHPQ